MAKAAKKKAKKNAKNEAVKWGVRAGIAVLLLVLIVLAIIDFRAKQHANATTTAWLNLLQSATDEQQELLCSELEGQLTGQPEITGEFSGGRVVYTWDGIFRSYRTTVTCEGADDPVVLRIEGPAS